MTAPQEDRRTGGWSFRARELTASLTVSDLARSLAWYRDVVGFTISREFERDGRLRAVSLVAGTVRILLTQDDGAKGTDRDFGVGFSLMLVTGQDIDDVARHVAERGATFATEPTDAPHGPRMFRLRDPDGYTLTFSSQ